MSNLNLIHYFTCCHCVAENWACFWTFDWTCPETVSGCHIGLWRGCGDQLRPSTLQIPNEWGGIERLDEGRRAETMDEIGWRRLNSRNNGIFLPIFHYRGYIYYIYFLLNFIWNFFIILFYFVFPIKKWFIEYNFKNNMLLYFFFIYFHK